MSKRNQHLQSQSLCASFLEICKQVILSSWTNSIQTSIAKWNHHIFLVLSCDSYFLRHFAVVWHGALMALLRPWSHYRGRHFEIREQSDWTGGREVGIVIELSSNPPTELQHLSHPVVLDWRLLNTVWSNPFFIITFPQLAFSGPVTSSGLWRKHRAQRVCHQCSNILNSFTLRNICLKL